MGYRSDVGIALTKKGVATLQEKLASQEVSDELRASVKKLLSHADEHYSDAASGAEVWYWEWIKWYGGHVLACPQISFIEDTISEMGDENYYFIRIGEENDDTEVRGCFWDNPFEMYLTRGINFRPAA